MYKLHVVARERIQTFTEVLYEYAMCLIRIILFINTRCLKQAKLTKRTFLLREQCQFRMCEKKNLRSCGRRKLFVQKGPWSLL